MPGQADSFRACLGLASLLLLGCFGEEETPFPPGLEPLEEENLAALPPAQAGEPYPEELVMVRDFASDASARTPSVHARGYVRASVHDTWEALRDPDVGADRRVFSAWTVTADVDPDYDYSYVIHSVSEGS